MLGETSIINLDSSLLWFSSLVAFNDPFEGKYNIRADYPNMEQSSALKIKEEFRQWYKTNGASELDLKDFDRIDSLQETVNSIFQFLKDMLSDAYEANNNRRGHCCFCQGDRKVLQNKLMWSHYSEGLRGFCLIFDENILMKSLRNENNLNELHKVPITYQEILPEIDPIDELKKLTKGTDPKLFNAIPTTKSKVWEYEDEVRLISENQGLHKYSSDALIEIVIGNKMEEPRQSLLKSIIKAKYPTVKVSYIDLRENEYKLEISEGVTL